MIQAPVVLILLNEKIFGFFSAKKDKNLNHLSR
jgi:hypothetical protein